MNYGSKDEIISACKKLSLERNKKFNITNFEKKLYTKNIPDPQILIRTGGTKRLSNFLLWQIAYTEIYMTDTYWPAFREEELMKSIFDFQSRERRFGKVSEQVANTT